MSCGATRTYLIARQVTNPSEHRKASFTLKLHVIRFNNRIKARSACVLVQAEENWPVIVPDVCSVATRPVVAEFDVVRLALGGEGQYGKIEKGEFFEYDLLVKGDDLFTQKIGMNTNFITTMKH